VEEGGLAPGELLLLGPAFELLAFARDEKERSGVNPEPELLPGKRFKPLVLGESRALVREVLAGDEELLEDDALGDEPSEFDRFGMAALLEPGVPEPGKLNVKADCLSIRFSF
jgi:hypothetical protein